MLHCPMCDTNTNDLVFQDGRDYYLCPLCQLVFVPAHQHLSPGVEKSRYDLHRNHPDDPGYRRFLERLLRPLAERLAPAGSGLDFGSGPGPTLSLMLEEAGHRMSIYDPIYADNPDVLKNQYDFITATEVIEHLYHPLLELDLLWSLLRPGGYLALMTTFSPRRDTFSDWYYKNDDTHVCFFSRQTFAWLARRWQAQTATYDSEGIDPGKADIQNRDGQALCIVEHFNVDGSDVTAPGCSRAVCIVEHFNVDGSDVTAPGCSRAVCIVEHFNVDGSDVTAPGCSRAVCIVEHFNVDGSDVTLLRKLRAEGVRFRATSDTLPGNP
ncbi:class I SAM-dependent methyltransferase [bacterium]|nr:class I SAM-dependent methyltransferase [bacterium]